MILCFSPPLSSTKNRNQFSQVELPLLRQQIFPTFVKTMTVLRHPIERVVSSYRMIRSTFLNEPDWNMKAWLLHSAMPPLNQTHVSNSNSRRRLWTTKKVTGPAKPFPQDPIGDGTTQLPNSVPTPRPRLPRVRSPLPRILPTDDLDENYMTKWFCGKWSRFPATEECYRRALANLNKFDFVFLTESLSSDLPLTAKLLKLNTSQSFDHVSSSKHFDISHSFLSCVAQVTPYNIRMHDPKLENSHDLNHATNITDLSSIPEFSKDDGTYEIAVRLNQYDFKLYRHAIFRNCITLNKKLTVQDCKELSSTFSLKSKIS